MTGESLAAFDGIRTKSKMMNMNAFIYTQILVSIFLATSSFAAPGSPSLTGTRPEALGKKPFENFEVMIVTGHDKDGRTEPPYLIITEQRFIGEKEMPYACLSGETLRVLVAGLLVSTTSDFKVGEQKVTVIRNIYEFKPPAKRCTLRPDNFDNLKDSHPFYGLIIDTDGKEIHGDIDPPQKLPQSPD